MSENMVEKKWEKYRDTNTQLSYFKNIKTGQVEWELPKDVKGEEVEDMTNPQENAVNQAPEIQAPDIKADDVEPSPPPSDLPENAPAVAVVNEGQSEWEENKDRNGVTWYKKKDRNGVTWYKKKDRNGVTWYKKKGAYKWQKSKTDDATSSEWEENKDRNGVTWYKKKGAYKWQKSKTDDATSSEWEENKDRNGVTWYKKKGAYKWQKSKTDSTSNSSPSAVVANTDEDENKIPIKEWIDHGNNRWSHGATIVTQKPTTIHKKKDEGGKIVYYYDTDEYPVEMDEYPTFNFPDATSYDVIVDYNPLSISEDKLDEYYEKLKAVSYDDALLFKLPDLVEEQLQTYNIHYIEGIYKNEGIFSEKITQLENSIKGLRSGRAEVFSVNKAIEHYKKMNGLLEKKNYIYFPHIEFTASGCFLMEAIETKEETDDDDAPKYKISAYTQPNFEAVNVDGNTYQLSLKIFSEMGPKNEETYNQGSPEYKFFYKIKFNSCIGECGIIMLQHLLIRNIMTLSDPLINTSEEKNEKGETTFPMHIADITEKNSILIINSGKNAEDKIIRPSDDILKDFSDFQKAKIEPKRFYDMIKSTSEEDPYNVIFKNNYRRNVLEMLYFFSDTGNSKLEDIKPIEFNMPDMAENLLDLYNKVSQKSLGIYPPIDIAKENYITGGGIRKKPQNIRIFLDRLKRIYNRYIRRNNKRTKKKRPKKNKTHRKKKQGIKKSKKN